MSKFQIAPEETSYGVADGPAFIATKLEGGQSRFRADKIGTARVVDVQWTFDKNEFIYFNAFYDTTIVEGALPFTIDLIINDADPVEHTAHFLPETKKVSAVTGFGRTVQAQLEVLPTEFDDTLNLARVAAYEADSDADLSAITASEDSPPVTVGLLPDQSDNEGTTISSLDTSPYFDDPDTLGLTYTEANLPAGLSLNSSTGVITGTLTEPPTILSVTITATNSAGFAQQNISWAVVMVV